MNPCANCGSTPRPSDRFCNTCGTPVAALPQQPAYAPQGGGRPRWRSMGRRAARRAASWVTTSAPGQNYCPQGHPIALEQVQFAPACAAAAVRRRRPRLRRRRPHPPAGQSTPRRGRRPLRPQPASAYAGYGAPPQYPPQPPAYAPPQPAPRTPLRSRRRPTARRAPACCSAVRSAGRGASCRAGVRQRTPRPGPRAGRPSSPRPSPHSSSRSRRTRTASSGRCTAGAYTIGRANSGETVDIALADATISSRHAEHRRSTPLAGTVQSRTPARPTARSSTTSTSASTGGASFATATACGSAGTPPSSRSSRVVERAEEASAAASTARGSARARRAVSARGWRSSRSSLLFALAPTRARACPRRTSFASTRARACEAGAPILTTVVEVVQFNSLTDGARAVRDDEGLQPALDCMSDILEKPKSTWSAFPFLKDKATLLVKVDGRDRPATVEGEPKTWAASLKDPNVGTAWLVVLDAAAGMGSRYLRGARGRQRLHPDDAAERPHEHHDLRRPAGVRELEAGRRTRSAQLANVLKEVATNVRRTAATARCSSRSRRWRPTASTTSATARARRASRCTRRWSSSRTARVATTWRARRRWPRASTLTRRRGASRRTTRPRRRRRCRSSRSGSRRPSSLLNDVYKNNDEQFMQALANPEVGGFFDIVREIRAPATSTRGASRS